MRILCRQKWGPLRDIRPGCGDMFQVASAGGAEALGAGQPEGLGGWWRGLREIFCHV